MGKRFQHFDIEQRCEIARRRQAGESLRKIAAALDCAPSSVARELKRNASAKGYQPSYARDQAWARRWRGSKLLRNQELQTRVRECLARGWSPETVSAALANEGLSISYESIYRFIQAQIDRTNDYSWRHYLPRAKSKRGRRARPGGSPVKTIQGRVSLNERPLAAADRAEPGHWEADLMLFSEYGQAVLVTHERTSRLTILVPLTTKAAVPTAETLYDLLRPLPPHMRRSIAFDNGTEFAQHHTLRQRLGIQTFFCDPHAPWQKGGVENAIGRLRRWLPRRTDIRALAPGDLHRLALHYNHTPRKCLGFRTPAQVFAQVLHFKCEFSFQLPLE